MPKPRIERMKDYLNEGKSLREKLEKIGAICADDMNLYDDEKALISDTLRDIFVPTKEENGVKVFDKEKAAENIGELQRFKADLVAKRGQERVMWLRYFDKKDGTNISVDGRNENINRAIDMSNMSGNFLIFNAMSGAITGLFDGELPPMDGSPDNTEEYIKTEVFRQPDEKDFVNEGQEIYYKIGSMESKKLKEVSPEQKEADKKLFGEYNNFVQSFFSNGNNAPWYNDEEIKEIIEKQSGKQVTYDKNVIDPIMSEVMSYPEVNIKEEYDKHLTTFMEPDKYDTCRRLAVFKQISEGKKLGEIKVGPNDIEAAQTMYDKCKNGQMSQEIADILADSVYRLQEINMAIAKETDKEKINEFLKMGKDLAEFHKGFDMDARDWGRTRNHIIADENEFNVFAKASSVYEMARNMYEIPAGSNRLDSKDQDVLAHGGFRNTALDRMSSVGYTAYTYKLLNTPNENRPNGYDPEFAKGCGREYVDFMAKYPVFEKEGKTIADKDKLKENVKKHAEFYKKWGEMLAKEPLEDFTDPEKLRDPKVIERAMYLNQMAIEFSQNSENLRSNKETGAMFMESFGGEEYYERLTNVVGLHQTLGLSVMTYANPQKDISSRAGALSFLAMCKQKGGSLEGKTVMDLDPALYSYSKCEMFTAASISSFQNLSSTEVTDYLNKGKIPGGAKKSVEDIFNSYDDEKAPETRNNQMRLKKELSGKKWTLLDEALATPDEKRSPKYAENPFEQFKTDTKLSDEFVKTSLKSGDDMETMLDAVVEFKKAHSNAEIADFHAEGDDVSKGFDDRNIPNFVRLLARPGMSNEELKEFTRDVCEKLYFSKEEREKILDKVYDKLDNFDVRNYDLSCLNGTDKGKKGPDGLTPSERDLYEFQKVVLAEQAFRTTRYGFRDYFSRRYNTLDKIAERNAKSQSLMSFTAAVTSLYTANNLNFTTLKKSYMELEAADKYTHERIGLISSVTDIQNKMLKGEIENDKCNLSVKLGYQPKKDSKGEVISNKDIYDELQSAAGASVVGVSVGEAYGRKDYENVYIDGIRATEFAEPLQKEGENIQSTISRLATNGKHRIEMVNFGIDKEGNIAPIIQTIEPYDTDFYKSDEGRESRIERIREDVAKKLGPEKKVSDVLTGNAFDVTPECFENMSEGIKGKSVQNNEKQLSFEEEIKKLQGELKSIDTWYHRNSKEFKDTLEALNHPEDTKGLLNACNAYINKYVKENESFERRTDLGNARISKITEIKCLVKDKEFEDKNKVFEGISKRKQERVNKGKENVKLGTLLKEEQKESGVKTKEIGKTEIEKRTVEKKDIELGNVK